MDLRVGFEIHQQLDTHKLFCSCPSLLREDEPRIRIRRRLRPTQSELGTVDPAAMEEFLKGKGFLYEIHPDSVCLVEADEEPPHLPNLEAVETALVVATLLKATLVDETHFMRKIVIDGSNPSGFQRTAIVALNGSLETEEGIVRIPTICLEEEAARKIREEGMDTVYRLDRLGIPLIEVTTAPDIRSGEQARRVALQIGELFRATGRVKRGIGTIRQDVNVSIEGGARVEIKGVQDLNQIPRIIEKERERQERLLEAQRVLKERGVSERGVGGKPQEVTRLFEGTDSTILKTQIRRGGVVMALPLPGYEGLLKGVLGPEFAQHARVSSGIGGIFHTDELPGYGITEEEVKSVRGALSLPGEASFVLAAGEAGRVQKGLEAVVKRALSALKGVPEETRMAREDGTTVYMRPLPGAARMYPETDLPPLPITTEWKERVRERLPELYSEKISRLTAQYGLGEELASQLVHSENAGSFEKIVEETRASPVLVANTLLGTVKDLERKGIPVESLTWERLLEAFEAVEKGQVTKEALPEVLALAARSPTKPLGEILREMGTEVLKEKEIVSLVRRVLEKREAFAREKGPRAAKPLMGVVMKELRGRADGEMVSRIVERELKAFLERSSGP
jgi:glutamyl-tRNA(Gln) amidotransferase subunit E